MAALLSAASLLAPAGGKVMRDKMCCKCTALLSCAMCDKATGLFGACQVNHVISDCLSDSSASFDAPLRKVYQAVCAALHHCSLLPSALTSHRRMLDAASHYPVSDLLACEAALLSFP
jgi:hypothetical protein